MAAPPLDGLRVLELAGGVSGPYCGLQLADLGATVIKVEAPGGDPARGWGPPLSGPDSAIFRSLNQSKQSVVLDLQAPAGQAVARDLARRADVLIEDLGPGNAVRWGLAETDLRPSAPGLIYCAITPFGEKGPLADQPGSELVVQARSEYPASLGRIGDPPVRVGTDIAGMNTGIFACQAILAALYHRRRTGEGQRVAVSQLGSLIHTRGIIWNAVSDPDEWWGFHCDSYVKPPDNGYEAADGRLYFSLGRGDSEDWDQILIEFGMTDVLADHRFADGGRAAISTGRYAHEVKDRWNQAFAERSVEDILGVLTAHHCNAVPMHDYPGLLAHPQVTHLDIVQEVTDSGGEPQSVIRAPWNFADSATAPRRAAPALGADSLQVVRDLGYSADAIADLRRQGALRSWKE